MKTSIQEAMLTIATQRPALLIEGDLGDKARPILNKIYNLAKRRMNTSEKEFDEFKSLVTKIPPIGRAYIEKILKKYRLAYPAWEMWTDIEDSYMHWDINESIDSDE